jgi:hypothetical protein
MPVALSSILDNNKKKKKRRKKGRGSPWHSGDVRILSELGQELDVFGRNESEHGRGD